MGYVRLVGEPSFSFQIPRLLCIVFLFVLFSFYFIGGGRVENNYKSLPNYIEKISLLQNAKDHQISTWGKLPIFHAKNSEKNVGSGTELSQLQVQWLIANLLKECK